MACRIYHRRRHGIQSSGGSENLVCSGLFGRSGSRAAIVLWLLKYRIFRDFALRTASQCLLTHRGEGFHLPLSTGYVAAAEGVLFAALKFGCSITDELLDYFTTSRGIIFCQEMRNHKLTASHSSMSGACFRDARASKTATWTCSVMLQRCLASCGRSFLPSLFFTRHRLAVPR